MYRREFIKICALSTAVAAAPRARGAGTPTAALKFHDRVRLMDEDDKPLRAEMLAPKQNYIFFYPFQATPCFLLNLGAPTSQDVQLTTKRGEKYLWQGGVGPNRSLVAYSAICAHRMSYPAKHISFISFRERAEQGSRAHANMIHCCSEHSEYDPTAGAKVVGGPAPQPLATILLEYDGHSDGLYAVGALGGEMFDEFLTKFEFRLALEMGPDVPQKRVTEKTVVRSLANFCQQQVAC